MPLDVKQLRRFGQASKVDLVRKSQPQAKTPPVLHVSRPIRINQQALGWPAHRTIAPRRDRQFVGGGGKKRDTNKGGQGPKYLCGRDSTLHRGRILRSVR